MSIFTTRGFQRFFIIGIWFRVLVDIGYILAIKVEDLFMIRFIVVRSNSKAKNIIFLWIGKFLKRRDRKERTEMFNRSKSR